ncbi:MAG: hypothetical protein HQL05_07840 [Nitrospirae bacterium]|nr:hypothetical protein [Nitrospirota bacterium]
MKRCFNNGVASRGVFHLLVIFFCLLTVSTTSVVEATENSELPDVVLSVKPLNLEIAPTTEDIMSAGQLGGQLYPTREVTDKQSEGQWNLSFATAIQQWNRHEYRDAVVLFKKHIGQYPDSPWVSEAVLHIGCDAHYNGRFNEAEGHFKWIIAHNQDSNYYGAKILKEKAILRLAALKISQNNIDDAITLFVDLQANGLEWRTRTYAGHWIHRLNRYQSNELAMLVVLQK